MDSPMATITLKNVPEALHANLKRMAERHGRSLNREVLRLLEESLGSGTAGVEALVEDARRVRESLGLYLTQKDIDDLKSEGRP
jgi:plasmid stability protein